MNVLTIKSENSCTPTHARVLRIDIPQKRTYTPQRAMNARTARYSELSLLNNDVNIAEIYKGIDIDLLNNIDGDSDKQDDFINNYLRSLRSTKSNTIVVGMFEIYLNDEAPLEEKHMDYISDLIAAPQVDVVATPLFAPRYGEDVWFNYMKRFIDNVRDKPIIATIPPSVKHTHIKELMEKLLKLDVRMFALNFNGTSPAAKSKYPRVRAIRRTINENQNENDAILFYGLNTKYGKIIDVSHPPVAKDMLSPVLGVDIFGTSHKRAFPQPDKEPIYRVFDDQNYVYQNMEAPSQARYISDKTGCAFPITNTPRDIVSKRDYIKCINAERQSAELLNVSATIKKNTTHAYILSKSSIANDPELLRIINEPN